MQRANSETTGVTRSSQCGAGNQHAQTSFPLRFFFLFSFFFTFLISTAGGEGAGCVCVAIVSTQPLKMRCFFHKQPTRVQTGWETLEMSRQKLQARLWDLTPQPAPGEVSRIYRERRIYSVNTVLNFCNFQNKLWWFLAGRILCKSSKISREHIKKQKQICCLLVRYFEVQQVLSCFVLWNQTMLFGFKTKNNFYYPLTSKDNLKGF